MKKSNFQNWPKVRLVKKKSKKIRKNFEENREKFYEIEIFFSWNRNFFGLTSSLGSVYYACKVSSWWVQWFRRNRYRTDRRTDKRSLLLGLAKIRKNYAIFFSDFNRRFFAIFIFDFSHFFSTFFLHERLEKFRHRVAKIWKFLKILKNFLKFFFSRNRNFFGLTSSLESVYNACKVSSNLVKWFRRNRYRTDDGHTNVLYY